MGTTLILKNVVGAVVQRKRYVEIFLIIFYVVGFIGISLPYSHIFFLKLFPVALLLSFTVILIFHEHPFDVKTITIFTLVGLVSFSIEVLGVQTHLIFGNYSYGNALGIKLFDTPLLIAVNWVMLIYAGNAIAEKTPMPVVLKIIFSSFILLIYDIILEQVAPLVDMWYWQQDQAPLKNYFAWFIIALFFQTLIRITGTRLNNSIAQTVILIQSLFFISLIILFIFIK
jgi:bisanhydrobacterioruberin hydratase